MCLFFFVSTKTGRDTSCRYTPMYIGLLCRLASGDMSMFVILDHSVIEKEDFSKVEILL